ncbi:Uncharacterized protein APZ42_002709, partial [Daphnia magna]
MTRAFRDFKRDLISYEDYQTQRTEYFSAVKQAKAGCWNNFLEKAEGKEIFKAYKYTKNLKVEKTPILNYVDSDNESKSAVIFDEKCNAFISTLFRKSSEYPSINWSEHHESEKWEWHQITEIEIKRSVFSGSKV